MSSVICKHLYNLKIINKKGTHLLRVVIPFEGADWLKITS